MNSKKQIILISLFFIIVITIFFINIYSQHKNRLTITEKEIIGLEKISRIHEVNILLKAIRGLEQLEESQANALKQTLFISDNKIFDAIKSLDDKAIMSRYRAIISSKHLSKKESFKEYTYLLKLLDQQRFNIADSSSLLFENNRSVYLLMSIAVLNIPDAIENIGKIRGIGVGILNKNNSEKERFTLKTNIQFFLNRMDKIKFILSKLKHNEASKLNTLIDSIITDFYSINNIVQQIEQNTATLRPQDFFLDTTKLVNQVNSLFVAATGVLHNNLRQRVSYLKNKILLSSVLYSMLIIMIMIISSKNYYNIHKEITLTSKKQANNQFLNTLRDQYTKQLSLKQICENSLGQIIHHFKAINGSLYLYDQENEKLYLGASYGIKKEDLKQSLYLHENLISENISDQKVIIMDIEQSVSLGNIEVKATKLVTLPVFEFEHKIGSIQLLFDHQFDKVDPEFLTTVISSIASYIFKAQKDDEAEKYLKLINKNVLISKTDLEGNIIDASEAFCTLSKYSKDELTGQNHRIFRHDDMLDSTYKSMWDTITKGQTWSGEIHNKDKNNESYWVNTVITPDSDINGNIIGYTALRTDITDKKKLEKLSITDGLTSLFNRRHFDNIFPRQIEATKRNHTILAFVLIDIDHFKQYNDSYGHQEGDRTLKKVANTLKNTLMRPNDYVFRIGGEEFAMLFSIKNRDNAAMIANKAKKNIEDLKIEHIANSASAYITISLGVQIIDSLSMETTDTIYKKTDDALYRAKQNGRNQIAMVHQSQNQK